MALHSEQVILNTVFDSTTNTLKLSGEGITELGNALDATSVQCTDDTQAFGTAKRIVSLQCSVSSSMIVKIRDGTISGTIVWDNGGVALTAGVDYNLHNELCASGVYMELVSGTGTVRIYAIDA